MTSLNEKIITLSGVTDEIKIDIVINITKDEICNYCKCPYVDNMENMLIEMVCFKLARLDNTHLKSLNFNDINQTFNTDYPREIIRQLNGFKKVLKVM